MAKPHKLAWNGVDIETVLTVEQVGNLAQRAAQESTGDAEHGRHRVTVTPVTDRQLELRVTDFEVSFKKLMVFYLELEQRGGRTWLTSRIDWYLTQRGFFGGRTMIAHHTYLQFVHNLARVVRTVDPAARIVIREGVAGQRPVESLAPESLDRPQPPASPAPEPAAPRRPAAPLVESFAPPGQVESPPVTPPSPRLSAPPALVTSVPGLSPRQPDAAEPEPAALRDGGAAALAEQLFAEDEELYATRIAQQGADPLPWFFTLPDGAVVRLVASVVVGRNPVAPQQAPTASPVLLQDPARSVSKTHALLELRDHMVWVTDLHSTNGSVLTNNVGEALVCEPGVAMPVGDGWRIGFGEYTVAVARRR